MASSNKVLFDTSALLALCEDKADISEIEKIGKVEFFVTESVINELNKLAEGNVTKAKNLGVIKKIIKDFDVLKDGVSYADNSLEELSKDYIIVTNDSELSKKIRKKDGIVYRMNNKKRFVKV